MQFMIIKGADMDQKRLMGFPYFCLTIQQCDVKKNYYPNYWPYLAHKGFNFFFNSVYFFVILRNKDVNIIHRILRGCPKRVTVLIF